ncbi:Methionine import ATP-binding protein MetN [Hondaea fermentalgiana]|uniref:Methionine import ATP-binding protein MetN n=1 Tax=Hondaea fermentalgiana TaxID=2315210 RepID=A0A2R5G1X5_9STRA|nr:Methionine import ATP-binding protein MetN [Hondaea fermentalgiana]|eukprot:GBG25027.1 Methionine import ATP-binding protein MetN [Hondaea fermentalgiana]
MELVSFETTLDFVRSHGTDSVGFVCGGINSARARSLVVRFGLINAWTKQVGSLSSGELRKLTLARAMANAPDLLLIDGAHDGLDPKSRFQLSGLLAGLARGLPKLLVQLGGSGHAAPKLRARLLQVSHRAEEFATEIGDVFSLADPTSPLVRSLIDTSLPLSFRSAEMEKVLADAHDTPADGASRQRTSGQADRLVARAPEDAPAWYASRDEPIVNFDAATVTFAKPPGPNDRESPSASQEHVGGIRDLRLRIESGEFWAFVGKNGAGKSSLVKLMASPRLLDQDLSLSEAALGETKTATKFSSNNERDLVVLGEPRGSPSSPDRISEGVGVVSMDGHMRTLFYAQRNPGTLVAADVMRSGLYGAACSGGASLAALETFLDAKKEKQQATQTDLDALCAFVGFPTDKLQQPFETLGLGEQRLVLVARALIHKPRLLVFDEASQGLDAPTREGLKALLTEVHDFVPQIAIIVITHHSDEIPDGVTHMLHLEAGQALHNGPVESITQDMDDRNDSILDADEKFEILCTS